MPRDWVRLGSVVRQRRAELGLTRDEVYLRGGPSDTTQEKVEKGSGPVNNQTLAKLDAGLGWTLGSATRVTEGDAPTVAAELPDQAAVPLRYHQAAARIARRPYEERSYIDLWSEWMDHTIAAFRLEIEYGRRRRIRLEDAKLELSQIMDSVQSTPPGETWQPPWDEREEYIRIYGVDPDSVDAGRPVKVAPPEHPTTEEYARGYLHEVGAAAYDGDPELSDPDDEVHPS